MGGYLSQPWNNSVSYLQLYFNEQFLSDASGFFWEKNGKIYLVTNWHVLSGRDAQTLAPLSAQAALPNTVNFFSYVKLGEANGNGQYIVEYKPATKPLCGESHEEAKWFEHPKYGHKADIGVLDVTESLISTQAVGANKLESNACLSPQVGQDAFVIGFPFGMNAIGAPAPVWKRASIALEPTYDPKGLPYILVDTATRPGMSGSLTLARHVLSQTTIQWKDGTTKEVLYQVEETALGVYSGRLDNKLDMAQLGMVWDIALVDEIIEAGILAKPTSK